MRLIDEARQANIKVAVCSAATKSSVVHVVKSLLGDERFEVGPSHVQNVQTATQTMHQ